MNTLMLMWLSWALIAVLFEIGHPGLFIFLGLAAGAVPGAILSYYNYPILEQIGVVALASFVMVLVAYLWARGIQSTRSGQEYESNIYQLQGKTGVVIDRITPHAPGQVKLGGETWAARPVYAQAIEVGAAVTVVSIAGCHVIVQPK